MNCETCRIKAICTINELKQKHYENIAISINSCRYKELVTTPLDTIPKWSVEPLTDDWLSSSFDEEEYKKTLDKLNEDSTADDLNIVVECNSCGGKDYQDQISVCSKCGKEICGNCSTSDNGFVYCKECWEAL